MNIKIRTFQEEDRSFILDSFLKSFHRESTFARNIRSEDYFKAHRSIAEALLEESQVLVACDKEDPDLIFGYFIFNPEEMVAHYIFVKKAFRDCGIARALFKESGLSKEGEITFTHWTKVMGSLVYKFPAIRYNPYLALRRLV